MNEIIVAISDVSRLANGNGYGSLHIEGETELAFLTRKVKDFLYGNMSKFEIENETAQSRQQRETLKFQELKTLDIFGDKEKI